MAALTLLAACGFWKPVIPRMETEDGHACVAGCDAEYHTCTGGNLGGGSGSDWPSLVVEMLGATLEHVDDPVSCPRRLETCYASCIDV